MAEMEVRDRRFDLRGVPRDWHPGGPAISAFFDNLSIFFPPGERFFIAAVKEHRDDVKKKAGPAAQKLLEDIAAFCAQEGIHSREHVAYNAMLEAGGVPAKEMEARVARLLSSRQRVVPRRRRLAATVALEHFTAVLGHILLSDSSTLDGANPRMAELWRWHAAEENEHKAVAYDVYQLVYGERPESYTERVIVMLITTLIFWFKVFEQQARVMKARRILFSPRQWWSFTRHALIKPGWAVRLVPLYLQFFRRDFHPWNHDNSELLEQWKAAAG